MAKQEINNQVKDEIMVDLMVRTQPLKNVDRQLLELDLKRRFILAKEYQQILIDKEPNFIGTFDNCTPRGFFEIFIAIPVAIGFFYYDASF